VVSGPDPVFYLTKNGLSLRPKVYLKQVNLCHGRVSHLMKIMPSFNAVLSPNSALSYLSVYFRLIIYL
jgi:hypothetical protein